MVILHCKGRTYGNVYLITFKVGPLCMCLPPPPHTHTPHARTHAHSLTLLHYLFYDCWKHQWKVYFGIAQSLAITFNLTSPWLRNMSPWGPFSEQGTVKKLLRATFGEYRNCVKTRMFFLDRDCCTTSDAWFYALSWGRSHCPCHFSCHFLRIVHRNDK
jgi:hypothetical protein